MRKALILPLVAVGGGIGGFFLRRWELASAFEPDTGLPIPSAPAALALIGVSVLVAAVLLLLCWGKHRAFDLGGYDRAFAAKGNTVYITAMVLSAFLLLAAGILALVNLPADYQTALAAAYQTSNSKPALGALLSVMPKGLLAGLTVAAFFCVLSLGKNSYRGEGKGKYRISLLVPGYMAAFWLICAYQTRAGDPVRQDYIYEVLAIIAVLLACYFISSFSFEKGKVTPAVLFSLLATYLCLVTLADAHGLSTMLLYGGMILYLTAGAAALLHNDSGRMPPVSAPEETGEIEIKTEGNPDEG